MKRSSVLMVFVAFLIAGPPASAADPPELGAENTLTGSEIGYVTVTIPRAWDRERVSVTATGGGLLRGMALIPEGSETRVLEGYRVGPEQEEPPRDDRERAPDMQPPGVYRFFLYADGQPARVVLKIPDLEGQIALTPDQSVPFDASPIVKLGQEGSDAWFGARASMTTRGLVIYYETYKFADGQQGDYSFCHFMPGSDTSDDAFRRPCRGRSGFSALPEALWFAPGEGSTTGSFNGWTPGTYGFGGWTRVRSGETGVIGGKVWAIDHFADRAQPPEVVADPPPAVPQASLPTLAPNPVVAPALRRVTLRLRCAGEQACEGQLGWPRHRPVRYAVPAGAARKVNLRLTRSQRQRLREHRIVRSKLVVRDVRGKSAARTVRLRVR